MPFRAQSCKPPENEHDLWGNPAAPSPRLGHVERAALTLMNRELHTKELAKKTLHSETLILDALTI